MKREEIAIEVSHLSLSYAKVLALWDISFSLLRGTMAAVLGPNGAGKSSLLQTMLGIFKPFSGGAKIFGSPVEKSLHRIAYVPQKKEIDWSFPVTVLDVALMGRYRKLGFLKWYRKEDQKKAMEVLRTLGLEEFANRHICALSGGQQQRLFLARALLQEPEIFLLDEPFANVDQQTEKLLVSLLHQERDQGKTIVIVHHDLSTVEAYFDQVILLKTSLIHQGTPKETLVPDYLNRAFYQGDQLFQEVCQLIKKEKMGVRL